MYDEAQKPAFADEARPRGSMVASPRHLKLVLDEVFDPPEKETQDCVYRALLWLAFAGIPRDRATLITVGEVDFYNMQIHHGGRDYTIYREGLAEFHKLCELDTLAYIHRNPDYEQRRPRLAGDQLLRGYGPKSVVISKICDDMTRRFSKSGWALTYISVAECGLYYEKFELERCGQAASFEEEAEQRLNERTESTEAALKNSRYKALRNYRIRYSQWKSRFPVAGE